MPTVAATGRSAAELLAAHLINVGLVKDPSEGSVSPLDWFIVIGGLPPGGPDYMVALADVGSLFSDKSSNAGVRTHHPLISITIRSLEYTTGMAKGKEIEDEMERFGFDDGSGPYWPTVQTDAPVPHEYQFLASRPRTTTMKIGQEEENRRQIFVANWQMTIQQNF